MKNIRHSTCNLQRPVTPRAVRRAVLQAECWALNAPRFFLIFVLRLYQLTLSPAQVFLFGAGSGCRFTPTCSAYAVDAICEHGAAAGSVLAVKRICRCHPWGGGGHDPVPQRGRRKAESGKFLENAHS
jgi:putative membrane protein insertion efficiency factor